MNEEKSIIEIIGLPASLEQLAEECAELGKASLKMARKLRDENPTPLTKEEILENLNEEMADVMLCITNFIEYGLITYSSIDSVMMKKEKRWKERLKATEGERKNGN